MRKFVLSAVLFFSLVVSANAKESFIDGMEDIPLAPNTNQIRGDNFSFGNEETRVVEAYLTSKNIKESAVENFYLDTLPQLGWKFAGKSKKTLVFTREQEELDIHFEKTKPLLVRVTLTGRP